MKAIWKYPILCEKFIDIDMPIGAEIICLLVQNKMPTLYAIVDTEQKQMSKRRFSVLGTGWRMIDNRDKYIGTWQSGEFVWHLFEMRGER